MTTGQYTPRMTVPVLDWRVQSAFSGKFALALALLIFLAFARPALAQPSSILFAEANAQRQSEVLDAQAQRAKRVEVTLEAPVLKVLADDTRGLPHQRFLICLANGTTVLVAHDTRMAPRLPLNRGDIVKIHGEYIWNEKGGVLHWTHHTDTPRHEGGWIELNGRFYQ